MPSRLRGPVAPIVPSPPCKGPCSPKIMQTPEAMQRSSSPDTTGRGSFSSVRENDSGLAQSFTSTKVSSYAEAYEDAVDDTADIPMAGVEFLTPMTRPHSKLLGTWYPHGTFDGRGWKEIRVKGRYASKSFSDLQALHRLTALPPSLPSVETPEEAPNTQKGGSGPSPLSALERLPAEILTSIISLLFVETQTNATTKRNADLRALLLTSQMLHGATIATLYTHITIPHSKIFRKFLSQISARPELGSFVRRLDFSHFNPSTLFSTERERAAAGNLTCDTLLECLELTPNLREFLAQEHIAENLGPKVLEKLFFDMPNLRAIDFCGSWHADFRRSFEALVESPRWPDQLTISRVSFHKTSNLPSSVFETIFPRLDKLTHLDAAGTSVTAKALFSIPLSARITHLNLSKCKRLQAEDVIKFLTTHPAVTDTLQVLSLAADASHYEMLDEDDLIELLPRLPKTLRSLSLKGSKMRSIHIPLVLPLTRQLEELSLGRFITVADVEALLKPDDKLGPHTLRYLDTADLLGAKDIDPMFEPRMSILRPSTAPLCVVEIAERPFQRLKESRRSVDKIGWTLKESGRRYWMVRNAGQIPSEDAYRPWKMGAESWGSRKIPVAVAEVGGMYGWHMFTRKL
ncbi:related to Leucine Rich Repeat domain protein [Cephalotrichum gorgonifer]|uniref:Related to Leucine Rich Repeat domain protein n=1 Tax=Cephalotrichum gorgonifer TaxID=2041049 RepID=A0AAE8N473_9PEZI|nr:related to Leucine Rich Repeat domain protein [Cephalotrichum gorgonifer]